jgi:hypothetical protein
VKRGTAVRKLKDLLCEDDGKRYHRSPWAPTIARNLCENYQGRENNNDLDSRYSDE